MTIEDFKKAKIVAMKEKKADEVTAYNAIISKLMLVAIERKAENKELSDDDITKCLKRVEKELLEEREGFIKAGRVDTVASLDVQLSVVTKYLPKMLSNEEIKAIILGLPDKSVPFVMKHFKSNFGANVDMKLVGEVLKSL